MSNAHATAQQVVKGLEALEALASIDTTDADDLATLSREALREAAEYTDLTVPSGDISEEWFADLAQAFEDLRDNGEHPVEDYLAMALEVIIHERTSLGSNNRTITQVEVLTGFGGPNIREYVEEDGDRIRVEVSWWFDEATEHAYAPNLAARVYETAVDYAASMVY